MVRIYGEFTGEASLARVGKGFAEAFPESHLYDLNSWGNDLDESAPAPDGADDGVGLFVGNLGMLSVAERFSHKQLWVMVTPNSNTLGRHLTHRLANVPLMMTPSEWAQDVLYSIFPNADIRCVPHGIDSNFRPLPRPEQDGTFRVLHLSSTLLARKGTEELLKGWAKAKLPNAELLVSVPAGRAFFFRELAEDLGVSRTVKFADRLDFDPCSMSRLYSTVDLVAQPSRGEGFGLVPLEARACGTPVLMTDCTGHSQHAGGPGCLIVPSGPLGNIDDFPGAKAPTVSPEDIAEGLQNAYLRREFLSSEAIGASEELRKKWSWENQLRELKDGLLGNFSR